LSRNTTPGSDGPRWRSTATPRRLRIGAIRLTVVPDGRVQLHPARWYGRTEPPWPAATVQPLTDADGYLVGSVGSLVVESAGHVIALDTGLGPITVPATHTLPALGEMRGGGLGRSWQALRLPRPTDVVITHLHEDHTGWWSSDGPFGAGLRSLPAVAGRADLEASPLAALSDRWTAADGGESIAPGVSVIALPGHTPGHIGLRIESEGTTLIAFGDAFHSPLQVGDPDVGAFVDADPEQAAATRRDLVEVLERDGLLAYGNHFADVPFGSVAEGRWRPAD